MRFAFIGTVEFSLSLLQHLLENGRRPDLVITKGHAGNHADYADLRPACRRYGIDIFTTTDINSPEVQQLLATRRPDLTICCGWSQIIGKEILQISRLGVVGYHPAALPRNRGRHPIIWALVLGLRETASTFFLMDEGADSGDILSQRAVSIEDRDDARSLYEKLSRTAKSQILDIITQFESGTITPIPQNHAEANYWRKRNRDDGKIDFRMNSRAIHNLVRALARPYPGAHVSLPGKDVKIWKVRAEAVPGMENIEPGKVLKIEGSEILVKCSDAGIWLSEHEFDPLPSVGDYLS